MLRYFHCFKLELWMYDVLVDVFDGFVMFRLAFHSRWRPGANHTQPANWCPRHPSADFVPCLGWQTALGDARDTGVFGQLFLQTSKALRRCITKSANIQALRQAEHARSRSWHGMTNRERERALHSEWIVIFFKPWQTSAMQEASSPICPGVYQTLSRGFVNLLLLGLSQILKQITRIRKTIPTCRWCHYLGRFFRNGRRTVNMFIFSRCYGEW